MDVYDEIRRALEGISTEAKQWPESPDMKVLIDAAVTLRGSDLREMIQVISQLSFHEGSTTK